jgi:hypothetical protein
MTDEANTPQDHGLYPNSGLIAAVEKVVGKEMSKDQVTYWQNIQNTYGVSDEDPLVMVLILLGVHQHLFNDLPERIKEATDRAITIHRTTLEDQATIVSKNILAKVTPMFVEALGVAGPRSAPLHGRVGWFEVRVFAFAFVAAIAGTAVTHFLFR